MRPAILLLSFALSLHAQEAKDAAFEVASIKPLGLPILKPGELLGLRYSGNRVSGRTQLFAMLQDAYSLRGFEIVAPNLGHDMYFLDAIMPVNTPGGPRKGISSAGGRGFFAGNAISMEMLAGNLGRILDHPVVDQTGRAGFYAMDLRWDPDDPMTVVPLLQRQLGLRLERSTLPFEMFVVDHIDQIPTDK